MKGQGRKASLLESLMNVFVGYLVAVTSQTFIYPLFGIHVTFAENLALAGTFTVISLVRGYVLRRAFNRASIRSDGDSHKNIFNL